MMNIALPQEICGMAAVSATLSTGSCAGCGTSSVGADIATVPLRSELEIYRENVGRGMLAG